MLSSLFDRCVLWHKHISHALRIGKIKTIWPREYTICSRRDWAGQILGLRLEDGS